MTDTGYVLLKDKKSGEHTIFTKSGQIQLIDDPAENERRVQQLLKVGVEIFEDPRELSESYPLMRCYRRILLRAPREVEVVHFVVDWKHYLPKAQSTKPWADQLLLDSISSYVGNRGYNCFFSEYKDQDTVSAVVLLGINEFPNGGFDLREMSGRSIPENADGFVVM